MPRIARLIVSLIVLCGFADRAIAQTESYGGAPIHYMTAKVNDPVAKMAARLESGDLKLKFDDKVGYLKSVLKELNIAESSQTLVFSKTSLQIHRIAPRRPRAIYFNDDVYVGYCQRGDVLELAATDAKQGATFYTIKQTDQQPQVKRDRGQCLSCHSSGKTQNVPGYLVRSVFANYAGRPVFSEGTYTIDHTSEFKQRWGGWYVTGDHGDMQHMGNVIFKEGSGKFDYESGANKKSLDDRIDTDAYLTPDSDIVALMVLEHQTQMHNAIAWANYETRRALHQSYEMNKLLDREPGFISDSARRRINSSAEKVLKYLLFADEFPLTSRVKGNSSFQSDFESRGARDTRGRALRDMDLQTRMFRYPCSYLIHSAAFDGLPEEARIRILERLRDILAGQDVEAFPHLTPSLRRGISEILRDTKPEFRKLSRQT